MAEQLKAGPMIFEEQTLSRTRSRSRGPQNKGGLRVQNLIGLNRLAAAPGHGQVALGAKKLEIVAGRPFRGLVQVCATCFAPSAASPWPAAAARQLDI